LSTIINLIHNGFQNLYEPNAILDFLKFYVCLIFFVLYLTFLRRFPLPPATPANFLAKNLDAAIAAREKQSASKAEADKLKAAQELAAIENQKSSS
jgi:hypothetical protein